MNVFDEVKPYHVCDSEDLFQLILHVIPLDLLFVLSRNCSQDNSWIITVLPGKA